jgi:hypothetical protein
MLRTFVSTIAFLLTAETIVLAQLPPQPPPVANPFGQATEQERAASHPDVIKHCRELVKDDAQSDVFAILGCLQTNRLKLSIACRQVLDNHGE